MPIKQIINIKVWLRAFLETYAAFLGMLHFCFHWKSGSSALFILPAERAGNLGDEAMLVGSIQQLRSQGIQKIGIVIFELDAHWSNLGLIDEVIVLNRGWDHFKFVHAAYRYASVYCIAADMMDGFYSDDATRRLTRLGTLAVKAGAAVSFLGFSFNEHPTPGSIQAIAQLPTAVNLFARDPISHARLTQLIQRPFSLVGDCAFLLKPAQDSEVVARVLQWIQDQRQHNRIVCGINVNNLLLHQSEKIDATELIHVYAKALIEIFERHPNLSILVIPHDNRGRVSDESLAHDLVNALPQSIEPYCAVLPFPCAAAEVKAVVAELDFVLTGRMHLAIACLGQGTPVAGIAYQGKFEGLFKHFDLTGMTIDPQQLLNPGALSQFMLDLLQQRQSLREQIQAKLPEVQTFAKANFN